MSSLGKMFDPPAPTIGPEQQARADAIRVARDVLSVANGIGRTFPQGITVDSLLEVAEWVLTGSRKA